MLRPPGAPQDNGLTAGWRSFIDSPHQQNSGLRPGRYQLDPPEHGTPYEPGCGSSASQKTVWSYALRCISALRANTVVPLLFDLANATVCADRPKGLGVSGKGVSHMLFLFGLRTRAKSLGQVERSCSKCARPTVHNAVESRRWFTLFFIPVIPLGGNQVVRCGVCGLTTKASPELKDQLATRAMAAKA